MKVAVVGAGIMGTSVAACLARRSRRVQLFDARRPGHTDGSSHGRSRIVRKAYPDPFYTAIMEEAYGMWKDLEEGDEPLFYETGLVYIGHRDAPRVRQVYDGLVQVGDNPEIWTHESAGTRHWGLVLATDEVAVFSRSAGWVRADLAWQRTLGKALTFGAQLEFKQVDRAELSDYDVVVWACGSGNRGLQPDLDVRVQTFGYLPGRRPGGVFIDDGEGLMYGFPNEPGADTFKVGYHEFGQPYDANAPREPWPKAIHEIECFVRRRFGIETRVVESVTCLYTMTPNEDFRMGWIDERNLLVSPCSGHGFKFAPWIGHYVADLVEGKRRDTDFPRFLPKPATLEGPGQ